jgi:lactate dehydrogenase-like 2-hydroxyacid dehydrogenase
MTVRQLPQAEAYLRAGNWLKAPFPLSWSLRDRTAGIIGMGRIGKAIARRLDAMAVPVVYHSRRPATDVPYRHYPDLVEMAKAVDVLIVITPGGAATDKLVNAAVLEALGANGILINVARGSVVDEQALIAALKEGRILSAGLDVFEDEPRVPADLIAMPHVVLLPHVGSASHWTRRAMGQLVVDNLASWADGKGPLTPVPETPPRG